LRSAALSALRFVDSTEADDLLISALSTDSDAEVRVKAAFSLSYREMNKATFNAQKKSFEADLDERVRLSVLDNLWKARQSFPEVVHLVQQAAATDGSKEVREGAAKLLAPVRDQ
jgi:HEAT repeat protein